MSEETKDKNVEQPEAIALVKEWGMLQNGLGFKSDDQYIPIIGCIEGHSVLPSIIKLTEDGQVTIIRK